MAQNNARLWEDQGFGSSALLVRKAIPTLNRGAKVKLRLCLNARPQFAASLFKLSRTKEGIAG